MIKFLALASLVFTAAACDGHCVGEWPALGSCQSFDPDGYAGGACFENNQCATDSEIPLVCVGGTCYPCGDATNPPEPCCGWDTA